MIDFIVAGIIIAIFGLSIVYIIREKKSGTKCIGCPYAKSCKKRNSSTKKFSCNDRF